MVGKAIMRWRTNEPFYANQRDKGVLCADGGALLGDGGYVHYDAVQDAYALFYQEALIIVL